MFRRVLSFIAFWIAVLLASTAIHPVNIYVAIATALINTGIYRKGRQLNHVSARWYIPKKYPRLANFMYIRSQSDRPK